MSEEPESNRPPDVVEQLFRTLRRLDAPEHRDPAARWAARPAPDGPWRGPYEAVEIACAIFIGDLGPRAVLFNRRTRQTFVVGQERFLARWARRTAETERALLVGLSKSIQRRVSRLRQRYELQRAEAKRRLGASDDVALALELLDLDTSAGVEEVRRRHRELALQHHPDRGGDLQRMVQINWAYETALSSVHCART